MGYPGKNHKSYQTPKRPWEKSRIESETRLVIEYGLRNKREVWKAQEHLRKYRKGARNLLALGSSEVNRDQYEAKKDELISHLQRAGLLGPDASIDDVLSLKVQTQLERRLQTVVYRRGLARSGRRADRCEHSDPASMAQQRYPGGKACSAAVLICLPENGNVEGNARERVTCEGGNEPRGEGKARITSKQECQRG